MIHRRITRGLALGTGVLASGAMVLAVAPAASAAEDAPQPGRFAQFMQDKPYVGARLVPTADGATVAHVDQGGPVDAAGIETGDIVVSIDGIALDHRGSLREALSGLEGGDSLTVIYTHDGAEHTATLTVGAPEDRPAPPAIDDVPWVGAQLFHDETADGVMVRGVAPESPASDAGLSADDVITAIDGAAVDAWWEAQEIVRGHEPGDVLELSVVRDGDQLSLSLTVGTASDAPPVEEARQGLRDQITERLADRLPRDDVPGEPGDL